MNFYDAKHIKESIIKKDLSQLSELAGGTNFTMDPTTAEEGDILIDPKTYSMKIKVGEKWEDLNLPNYDVSAAALRQNAEELRQSANANLNGIWNASAAANSSDPFNAGAWAASHKGVFDPSVYSASHARVKAAVGSQSQTQAQTQTQPQSQPWTDPLAGVVEATRNRVACIDLPKPKYDPLTDDDAIYLAGVPKIYYHDRWPTKPVNVLIDDALELINKKFKLNITVKHKDCTYSPIPYFHDKCDIANIRYQAKILYAPNYGKEVVAEVGLDKKIFDRTSNDIDKKANLNARLDTNTYITLRLAYVLYWALKAEEAEIENFKSDIFHVVMHHETGILPY